MKQVFTIPATASFVDALATYLLDATANAPERLAAYTVLVPNRRGAKALRDAFLRHTGGTPLLLPAIRPIGDVAEDELIFAETALATDDIPPPVSPLRRQIILSRYLLATFPDTYTTAQALATAAELSRFLDSVHTEGLSLDDLDTLVAEEYAAHWNISLTFLRDVLRVYWPDHLASESAIDPALHRRLMVEAYTNHLKTNPPAHPIIAAGSTGSIPATAALLSAIAGLPNGMVILPGLDTTLDDAAWDAITEGHPQCVMKNLLDTIGIIRADIPMLPTVQENAARARLISEIMRPAGTVAAWTQNAPIPPAATQNLHLLEAENLDAEATAIALIMREHASRDTDKTMLLITPDRILSNRVALMLGRWGITIDDSAGTPLSQTPIGTYLLLIVTALSENLSPVPLLDTLKHAYAAGGGTIANWRNFVRNLERHALRGIRPATLLARAPEHMHADINTLLDIFACTPKTTTDHIRSLLHIAQTLATAQGTDGATRLWSGEAGEAAARYFANLLEQGDVLPDMTWPAILDLLQTTMSSITVRPRYGTHPRLAILGAMEARLYQADTMILASLNENTWPAPATVDGWLSRPMRADFKLPAPERAITLSAHDFCQGLGAPNVYLTRSKLRDGAPTTPSRWLQRLHAVLQASHLPDIRNTTPYLHWAATLDMPATAIQPATRPVANPPLDARPTRLSVTDIATLQNDPYGIYAKYTLHLKPWDELDAEPGPRERGNLIHKVLETFARAHPDAWPDNAAEKLIATGRDVFAAAGDHPDITGHWWPRFERMAKSLAAFEQTWRHNTKAVFTEVDGTITIPAAGHDITLKGRADRIESRLGTGWAIIDYKSGTPPTAKSVTSGAEPQLTLLGAMLQNGAFNHHLHQMQNPGDIETLAYWPVSGSKDVFTPTQISDDTGTLCDTALTNLTNLLTAYMQGAPYPSWPDAAAKRPDYYPYSHFERVSEWASDTLLQDEDAA